MRKATSFISASMENKMSATKLWLASLFMLLSILACQLPVSKEESQALKENYLQLRGIWFTTKPEDLGIVALPGSKEPYAIVMDMGIGQETATFASSIAGDGSCTPVRVE